MHIKLDNYKIIDYREDKMYKKLEFCKYGIDHPGHHCFENKCLFNSYAQCSNRF